MRSILLCLLILSLAQAQQITVTNGASGTPCPRRRCLDGLADCVNGTTCVCRPPRQLDPNNGNFGCYRDNDVFGEVYNDPEVRNMNNERASFPFPCRYLLTIVTTNLRIRKKNVGFCTCDLHAFNLKNRGKLYVGGFDFACTISNTFRTQRTGLFTRIFGIARSGVYTYTEEGYLPVDIKWAGFTVRTSYDTVNNQAIIEIPECGSRITFVAYDVESRLEQNQKPGVTFAFNSAHQPSFHEHNRVIATAPKKLGGTTYAELAQPPFSISEALIIRAFTSGVAQNHTWAHGDCISIGTFLTICPESSLNRAANGCFWITDRPKFVRCLDPGTNHEPVLDIYKKCVGVHCYGTPTCSDFVNYLTATGCSTVPNIPELTNIVNGNFCP